MATYISVDSIFRDTQQSPNPAEFFIRVEETKGWATENRTVQSVKAHRRRKEPILLHEVTLLKLSIPYSATLLNEPYLYVEFSSTQKPIRGLINTLGNTQEGVKLQSAVFEVFFDKIQSVPAGSNLYIIYNCAMTQVMSLEPKGSYKFRVFNRTGTTIVVTDSIYPVLPSPTSQVSMLLKIERSEEADSVVTEKQG